MTSKGREQPLVLSIQVGLPRAYGAQGAGDPTEQPWISGIVKEPVTGPVCARRTNLDGDAQADLKHHGGTDKAILAYAVSHYPLWQEEWGWANLAYGSFGENLTIAGLDETSVCVGDIYEVGETRLQVSQPRQPCWKLARRWRRPELVKRVQQTGRTGWYLRVLREGKLEAGQTFQLVDRPAPAWNIARASQVMQQKNDWPAMDELAGLPFLAAGWRMELREQCLCQKR